MIGKVVQMTDVRELTLKEFEVPKPEKGALVMENIRSNICGSDVHAWEGHHVLRNHVVGHEMVGRILELGEGVTTDYASDPVKVGDRIVPCYYITCQKCKACANGLFNICENGSRYDGQRADLPPHFTGGFATHYYVQPNQYFYKVPDSISDNVAAGINCGITQVLYAMDQSGLVSSDFIVIQGAGGLGLFGCAIAKTMGAKVIVLDGVDSRLKEAEKFGADYLISMNEFDTMQKRIDEVNRITGGFGADVALEVAGVPQAFNEGLRMLRMGGTYLELGNVLIGEDFNTSIVPGIICRRCITVKGILRYQPWYIYRTMKFLDRYGKDYPFDSLTDRCYALEECDLAMEKARSKEVARVVFDPNPGK